MTDFLLGLLAGAPLWCAVTLWLDRRPPVEPPERPYCYVHGCTGPHIHPRGSW